MVARRRKKFAERFVGGCPYRKGRTATTHTLIVWLIVTTFVEEVHKDKQKHFGGASK
jgi:hypothetical protein